MYQQNPRSRGRRRSRGWHSKVPQKKLENVAWQGFTSRLRAKAPVSRIHEIVSKKVFPQLVYDFRLQIVSRWLLFKSQNKVQSHSNRGLNLTCHIRKSHPSVPEDIQISAEVHASTTSSGKVAKRARVAAAAICAHGRGRANVHFTLRGRCRSKRHWIRFRVLHFLKISSNARNATPPHRAPQPPFLRMPP